MKAILKLSFAIILLLCTNLTNGQLADTTLYKVKLEKFNTQVRASRIATISGLAATVAGGIVLLVSKSYSDKADDFYDQGNYDESNRYTDKEYNCYYIGGALGCAGIITSVISGINWGAGKNKIRQYQIRLDDARTGFYYNPKSAGVTLAFKF